MLSCSIERKGSAFMIRANDQLIPPYAYMTYQPAKGRYNDFRKIGVRFVSVAVYAGDRGINPSSGTRPFCPGFMAAPDVYDFRYVDADFKKATCGAAPGEAFILPRLMLEMPEWWEKQHPSAQCRDAAGNPVHCSFSSEEWLNAAIDAMEHFNAWLEESGWNEYIVGWHIAGGSTEEYIRPTISPYNYMDYSENSKQGYRRWLREKYSDIAALNAAWHTSHASFDEISVPLPAARAFPCCGDLRDPVVERDVMDYYTFYSDEIALFIRRLCAEGKRITNRQKLMGVFYGNVSICTTEISHNSMDMLLSCPDADFFASPFCYTDSRGAAYDWPFQATLESANLHGKPWFVEADVRTMLSVPISRSMPHANPEVNNLYDAPVWWGPKTLDGSLGDMLRAFVRILTHSAALWWFDMWGGWYDHAALMEFQKWAFAFYSESARQGGTPSRAQLAVFLDEKALNHFGGNMCMSVSYNQFVELGWVGAPYDAYLLSDFASVDPKQYRAAMLLSPVELTDAQKEHLKKWKCDGKTVIFTGYTSFLSGNLGDETEIPCELGQEIADVQGIYRDKAYPAQPCHAPKATLLPAYRDVVLARNAEQLPVAVLHRAENYQTVWSIAPELPSELVRDILLFSGAHIYVHGHEVVYAGGNLVAVHACSDGIKRVYLPGMGRAYDIFTDSRVPGTERWCEMNMQKGETRLLRLDLA